MIAEILKQKPPGGSSGEHVVDVSRNEHLIKAIIQPTEPAQRHDSSSSVWKDEERAYKLFDTARGQIKTGCLFRFAALLYSERKMVVAFLMHFTLTMIVWGTSFYILYIFFRKTKLILQLTLRLLNTENKKVSCPWQQADTMQNYSSQLWNLEACMQFFFRWHFFR